MNFGHSCYDNNLLGEAKEKKQKVSWRGDGRSGSVIMYAITGLRQKDLETKKTKVVAMVALFQGIPSKVKGIIKFGERGEKFLYNEEMVARKRKDVNPAINTMKAAIEKELERIGVIEGGYIVKKFSYKK